MILTIVAAVSAFMNVLRPSEEKRVCSPVIYNDINNVLYMIWISVLNELLDFCFKCDFCFLKYYIQNLVVQQKLRNTSINSEKILEKVIFLAIIDNNCQEYCQECFVCFRFHLLLLNFRIAIFLLKLNRRDN